MPQVTSDALRRFLVLPPEEQEKLKSHPVVGETFTAFQGLDEGERQKVFDRLDQSKPLSAPKDNDPGLLQKTKEAVIPAAPQAIGGFVGGVVGNRLGLPGRVVGSGIGAGLGEAVQIGAEQLGITTPRETDQSVLSRLGGAVTSGAFGEVMGSGIGWGVKKTLAPFAKSVTPAGKEAIEVFGEKVLPSQVTKSRTLDVLDNIASSSLLGGGRLAAFRAGQQTTAKQIADGLVDAMGSRLSADEAGDVIIDGVLRRGDAFKAAAKRLYGRVDELLGAKYIDVPNPLYLTGMPRRQLVGGGMVNTGSMKEFARGYLGKQGETLTTLRGAKTESLLKDVLELPDTISFSHAQHLRSELLQVKRVVSDPESARFVGATQQLSKHINTAMEDGAHALGDEALDAWKTADQFYKTGKETFYRRYVTRLIEKDPERIADYVLRPGAVSTVQSLKQATSVEGWKAVQSRYSQKLLDSALDVEGNLSASKLAATLKRFGPTSQEVLGPQAAEWGKLSRALTTIQAKQGEGAGKVFIQLKQAGAVTEAAGLFLGGSGMVSPGTAGTILLGPAVIGRLMTNPVTAKWLTTGLQAMPGTPEAIRASTQLVAAMTKNKAGASGSWESALPAEVRDVADGKAKAFLKPPTAEGTIPTAGEQVLQGANLQKIARQTKMGYFKGKDGTEIIFNPDLTKTSELKMLDKQGRLAEIVNGPGTSPKPANPTTAVTARTPQGAEVRTVLTATPQQTRSAVQTQPSTTQVEVRPFSQADDILLERLRQLFR